MATYTRWIASVVPHPAHRQAARRMYFYLWCVLSECLVSPRLYVASCVGRGVCALPLVVCSFTESDAFTCTTPDITPITSITLAIHTLTHVSRESPDSDRCISQRLPIYDDYFSKVLPSALGGSAPRPLSRDTKQPREAYNLPQTADEISPRRMHL